MPHPGDTIPLALVTVIAATFTADPDLDKVQVVDGSPIANTEAADLVAVGLSVTSATAIDASARPGWGGTTRMSLEIRCVAQAWTGDVELPPRRARVFELLTGIDQALKANQSLSGACERAYLNRWSYQPSEGPSGASALIEFTVRVDTRQFD